jgi:hypothetical protein
VKVCGPCGAWIPDDATDCPNCGKGGKTEPPAPPSPVKGRLRTLGGLYMAAGFVTLGLVAMSFLQHASGATLEAFDRLERDPGPLQPSTIREMKDLVLRPWYLALTHSVPFLLGCYWVWAGGRLRDLRGWTSAMAGAALLLLPVPCSPCCCLLMPLGIYAVIVLTRAESEAILGR